MSGIALSIALDKPDRTYEAGETITGRVNVSVSEKIQAGALVLVLSCKGISKAENIHRTIEKEKAEIKLFQGSWMPEEYIYPFECVFRRKPPPDSDSFRHLIPIEVATQFRFIPPWESDSFRHPLGRG